MTEVTYNCSVQKQDEFVVELANDEPGWIALLSKVESMISEAEIILAREDVKELAAELSKWLEMTESQVEGAKPHLGGQSDGAEGPR